MDHKIVTVCLMNSRRIHQTLVGMMADNAVHSDRDMAVVAALKLLEPGYQGITTAAIFTDLRSKTDAELQALSKMIHPVLCSLKFEKWLGVSGNSHYMAQAVVAKGVAVKRLLLDGTAMDIPQPELPGSGVEWKFAGSC